MDKLFAAVTQLTYYRRQDPTFRSVVHRVVSRGLISCELCTVGHQNFSICA
eukprot:SAG11_NODE_29890_length_306_cov_0.743961_1_plen_50_part_01